MYVQEAGICRLYYFNEPQINLFKELVSSMRNSRSALTALAIANILLSVAQVMTQGH